MKINIEFDVEEAVKIPHKNGKYLMFNDGVFKSVIYANGTGGEKSCLRIMEDYDSESMIHPCFEKSEFYFVSDAKDICIIE